MRSSSVYVAAFVGALAVVQLVAMFMQFQGGFRPFSAPPQRVALSWDMFAIPIERCDVRWPEPIDIEGVPLRSILSASPPFEWALVENRIEDYSLLAQALCARSTQPQTMTLRCFGAGGKSFVEQLTCPSTQR